MPRLSVHYACDRCGHTSTAEYFDYRYHETEAVRAFCGGCSFMTDHTPQGATRIADQDRPQLPGDNDHSADDQPRLETWRKFYQHGFTAWKCSRCGAIKQSLAAPDPCDCSG
ncbi:MAG: hypothetical protein OXI41_13900 [Chloroflexota bacterium]|nr:hypothetical protein [Chloroflexota bacterium]